MNKKNISENIQILLNQFNAKNYEKVINVGNLLLKKNPEYVILYNLVGSSYQNTGEYNLAKENFLLGLKLDPKNLALMNNLGMSYKNLLQYDLSEKLFLEIIKINSKYINAYINLGNLKRDLNQFDQAIQLYEKALINSNNNPIILYSLALAHQGIGNFEKALSYSKKVLDLDPKFTRADHLISQSKKYEENDEHYIYMKKKLDNEIYQDFEKINLFFSLSKAEEDFGNIENASKYLIKGNELQKKLLNYNVNKEIDFLKNIEKLFNKVKNLNKNSQEDKIIFILGMPRSGTSLVEQIITSHSEVFGGGELPILSNIIKKYFIENEQIDEEKVNKSIKEAFFRDKLRREYTQYIDLFKFEEKYITDKAPLNFRWIGFIKILFPNSKIIHCKRDPKNNCLSMYKNLFEGGLNFTYDQNDLVKYYKSYIELFNFWELKFPNTILNVNYEELISNKEQEIKKIIKFCNLKWEENCLHSHKNKTPIKTMSTAQARKPIYKSSLNSFEKYKDYLKILEKEL